MTARRVTRRDAGFSLTEVIVAVLLMSIAVVPIMLAAGVSVRSSTQSRTLARVETVLANAADRVNRAPEGCDYGIYVQAAALAEGWQTQPGHGLVPVLRAGRSAATSRHVAGGRVPGRRAARRARADGDDRNQEH